MTEFKSEAGGQANAQGRLITVAEANLIQVEWIVWARNEIDEARQIIADLLEYAEQNDPGNPHIGKAKAFLAEDVGISGEDGG